MATDLEQSSGWELVAVKVVVELIVNGVLLVIPLSHVIVPPLEDVASKVIVEPSQTDVSTGARVSGSHKTVITTLPSPEFTPVKVLVFVKSLDI